MKDSRRPAPVSSPESRAPSASRVGVDSGVSGQCGAWPRGDTGGIQVHERSAPVEPTVRPSAYIDTVRGTVAKAIRTIDPIVQRQPGHAGSRTWYTRIAIRWMPYRIARIRFENEFPKEFFLSRTLISVRSRTPWTPVTRPASLWSRHPTTVHAEAGPGRPAEPNAPARSLAVSSTPPEEAG